MRCAGGRILCALEQSPVGGGIENDQPQHHTQTTEIRLRDLDRRLWCSHDDAVPVGPGQRRHFRLIRRGKGLRLQSVVPAEVLPAGEAGLPFNLLYDSDACVRLPAAEMLPAGNCREELLLSAADHSAASAMSQAGSPADLPLRSTALLREWLWQSQFGHSRVGARSGRSRALTGAKFSQQCAALSSRRNLADLQVMLWHHDVAACRHSKTARPHRAAGLLTSQIGRAHV